MAGLAHLGVGLAAKRAAPRVPLAVLLVCAYATDLVFMVCWLLGLEHPPKGAKTKTGDGAAPASGEVRPPGVASHPDPPAPWSHGLFMAVIWSALAGLVAHLIRRRRGTSVFIALLVFSHWIVDFITQPMRAAFPNQLGLPLFFHDSHKVGLGLYNSSAVANAIEYGSVALGAAIYLGTLMRLRKERPPGPT
jgi:hypothetical protein